jgi:pantoate--beta-alanine ligase
MRIIDEVARLQALADAERAAGRRIALVPTMGALHAGHLALVAEARRRADVVVVSIFVNPAQFGPGEDLDRYPRTFEADLARCEEAGADVVFAPQPEQMYPPGDQTRVEVCELTRPLCGRGRPGHFRGVTTVVTKLLLAAKPHCAVFGEKDFQQLAAVRRLVRDLCFDTEIVGVPIVRESDGLALSSRNANLAPELRAEARVLSRALDAAERLVQAGEDQASRILGLVQVELAKAPSASVEYAELRDPESLEPAPSRLEAKALLALAVNFPGARLIDNRVLHPSEGRS